MDTIWLGVKLAFGFAIVAILIRAVHEIWSFFGTKRFVRAGCVYQQSERPGAPSGWLIRDITNNDWLLWDEKNRVTLRVADDAPPEETWRVSNETLKQFLSLAHQERDFWSKSEKTLAKQAKDS